MNLCATFADGGATVRIHAEWPCGCSPEVRVLFDEFEAASRSEAVEITWSEDEYREDTPEWWDAAAMATEFAPCTNGLPE